MLVENHWGWSPKGVFRWFRFGWAKPIEMWGVEETSGIVTRRVKVGPVCFRWGIHRALRQLVRALRDRNSLLLEKLLESPENRQEDIGHLMGCAKLLEEEWRRTR